MAFRGAGCAFGLEFGLNPERARSQRQREDVHHAGISVPEKIESCSEGSGCTPQPLLGAILRGSFMTVWVGATDLRAGQVWAVCESGTKQLRGRGCGRRLPGLCLLGQELEDQLWAAFSSAATVKLPRASGHWGLWLLTVAEVQAAPCRSLVCSLDREWGRGLCRRSHGLSSTPRREPTWSRLCCFLWPLPGNGQWQLTEYPRRACCSAKHFYVISPDAHKTCKGQVRFTILQMKYRTGGYQPGVT